MPERDEQERYEALARAALLEITDAATVGEKVGIVDEGEHTIAVQFASRKPGYPHWRWTVSIAHLPGEEPSVLEAELLPDEGALLAPAWVPWADRLAEWEAAQAALGDDEADDAGDDEDDDLDDDPSDEDVLDDDEALLHSGDLDGVDIDDLDDEAEGDDDDSDDDDSDDDDSDEDDSDEDDSDEE